MAEMLNIVLADDDPDDGLLFQDAVEELGLPVQLTIVQNGELLFRHLSERMHALPEVIFLDLNMPRKNGFSCLEDIKRSADLCHIPVVIISTSYDVFIAGSLHKQGAHYYIRKPTGFEDLKKAIRLALHLLQESAGQPAPDQFFVNRLKAFQDGEKQTV